jgi:hypothetical protein
MIRTQIQLTDSQARKVRRAARARGISVAEMIRRLIDRGIEAESPDPATRYARAARWVGAFRDHAGAGDVSAEHDRYLDQTFQ